MIKDGKSFWCLQVFIFLHLINISCRKELHVKNGFSPSLVIYPYLEVNQSIKVFAYSSAAISDTGKTLLENPLAYIYEDDKCIDTVSINEKGRAISRVMAKEKKKYTIRVTAKGYANAETDIVMPSVLTNLTIDTSSFKEADRSYFLKLDITFIDNVSGSDFYRVRFRKREHHVYPPPYYSGFFYGEVGNSQTYCESEYVEFYAFSGYGLVLKDEPKKLFENISFKQDLYGNNYVRGDPYFLSDHLFNGKRVTLHFLLSTMKYELSNDYYEYQLRVEVSKITSEFYQGLYSQACYNTYKSQDLPISEETPIYSSVKGGFGFAAASATVIDSSLSNQKYKDFFRK